MDFRALEVENGWLFTPVEGVAVACRERRFQRACRLLERVDPRSSTC